MSIKGKAAIVGFGETPVDRLGRKPGERRTTMPEYLSRAARLALKDAGLTKRNLDGQGLGAIYSTNYPQPFWPEEAAEILGISPGLLLGGGVGGASGVSLLAQAAAVINSGLVEIVLCVAAAAPFVDSYTGIHPGDTRDFEIPYGMMGPNSKIALVMRRHMHEYGTSLDHLAKIAVTSRLHASLNPSAYLRSPLTAEEYKNSRLIADPIRLLDCVMPANGGKAFIVASPERAKTLPKPPVFLLGFGERDNPVFGASSHSNALIMGVREAGETAFQMAGVTRKDIDFLELYDDYIIIVLMQIEDLGFCQKGDGKFFESTDFTYKGDLPIQTGGGMINCGQPSTAGGVGLLIEAARQLRGEGGQRQVKNARTGLVTGLGGVAYGKNLGCTAVAILRRET
ncbi:MAG: thiolase family protein [Candidatus Binatia bacterium]|jgi:acetyl-CoA acetyltransferase